MAYPDTPLKICTPAPAFRPLKTLSTFGLSLTLGCWIGLVSLTAPPTSAQAPTDGSQVDQNNRPLIDASGQRLSYTQEDLGKVAGWAHKTKKEADSPSLRSPSFRKSSFPIQVEWHRPTFGVGIGASGFNPADLDGDGTLELVAGGGPRAFAQNDFWSVMRWNGSEMEQVWASLQYPDYLRDLQTYDLDGDGDDEVIAAIDTGDILIYDGLDPVLLRTLSTAADEINSMGIADFDGDGTVEAAVADDDDLYVIDLVTGAQEFFGNGLGGHGVAVGNVDLDAALEIVTTDRYDEGHVIDASTYTVEWMRPDGFGLFVRTHDIDNDGVDEIIGGEAWYSIGTFDAVTQSMIYTVPVDLDLDAIQMLDFDGDGELEIVYGDGQWGEIHSLNAATGAEEAIVDNEEHGASPTSPSSTSTAMDPTS